MKNPDQLLQKPVPINQPASPTPLHDSGLRTTARVAMLHPLASSLTEELGRDLDHAREREIVGWVKAK